MARASRGWGAVLAAAGLVLSGVTTAGAAASVKQAPAASCAEAMLTVASASSEAQRCHSPVEVLDERTEWATTAVLPDGSMRLEVSTGAVRARDEAGEWVDVDNDVVPAGGVLEVASAVAPMSFSDGSGQEPFARIEREGHVLEFDVPFDLPAPSVDGPQVVYADVLPGVDLVVTVNADATGFSEVLRVESAKAARHPRLRELSFPIVTSDGIEVRREDGGFVAADASGEAVFTSPTPAMWDSSGAQAAAGRVGRALGRLDRAEDATVEHVEADELALLPAEVSTDAVTITPDAAMLTDEDTVWPVYIDPSASGTLTRRAAVRDAGLGTKYDFAGDEGVGLCSTAAADNGCSATFRSRLLWMFTGLQGLGSLAPDDVISATFSVTGTHSYSCTPQPVTLYAVADFDSSVAFPGGGYWHALQTKTIAHRQGCAAGYEPRLIEFDAKEQARAVAQYDTSAASFGIAADESSMAYWKRYGWDAKFSVEYNRTPSAPTNVRATNPYAACLTGAARPAVRSATPTLRATISDPDGGNVQSDFWVDDIATGTRVWSSGRLAAQGSGSEHAVVVTPALQKDRAYRWGVAAHDGRLAGPAVTCEFVVDLDVPVAPTVTPVVGMPAVYTEGPTANGGVGVEGRFQLGAGTSTDVAAYRYTFLGGQTRTVPVAYSTVAFVPTTVGAQTLTVESIDRAGWVSSPRVYPFSVAFPGMGGAWKLDEATGTSARNEVSGGESLTISAGVQRVPGAGAELELVPDEWALQLDALTDTATTTKPLVPTAGSYTIYATVRLDDAGVTATAVSQDGTVSSGFELGHRVDPACPPSTGGRCWAFSIPGSDGGTGAVVRSNVPVRTEQWVQLVGMRDASAGTASLVVCELGTAEDPGDAVPQSSGPVAAPTGWFADGQFQVGAGKVSGARANGWRGAIGQVRAYRNVLTTEQLRTACANVANVELPPAGAPTFPAAPAPLPPAPGYSPGYASLVHVWRGAGWWVNDRTDPTKVSATFPYGVASDAPVVGDWNGDGTDSVGVMRSGLWHLNDGNDGSAPDLMFNYGAAGDLPVVGDWDGDGKDTVGIVRGTAWQLNDGNDGSAPDRVFNYGITGDVPLVGDWNGDGRDGIGVFRAGMWYLNDQTDGSAPEYVFQYGNGNDVPVAGDWNGDGVDTVGVYRSGEWVLNDANDSSAPEHVFLFGSAGESPVRGSSLRR